MSKWILWLQVKFVFEFPGSVQFSSVTQSCPTLCNPMNHSTPGLPVHHQLPEFTQTHVHWVSDAIQPSHPLSSPSPPSESFPMSQLFAWGGQSTGVSTLASFLPKKSQGWSPSEWTGWISLRSKGLSRVISNTTVQKHQFFSAQPSSQSNSQVHTWPQEKQVSLLRLKAAGAQFEKCENKVSIYENVRIQLWLTCTKSFFRESVPCPPLPWNSLVLHSLQYLTCHHHSWRDVN